MTALSLSLLYTIYIGFMPCYDAILSVSVVPKQVDEEDEREDEHAYKSLFSPKVQVSYNYMYLSVSLTHYS